MLKRQTLRDYSDYSLKQINDNFMGLFLKLGGNIDYMDMRDGAVITDKIRDGAVTGDKILDGTLSIYHVDDNFVSSIELIENPTFLSLSNTVEDHGTELVNHTTAIQQNSKEIRLSADRITDNSQNIANLVVTADNITSEVVSIHEELTNVDGSIDGINKELVTAFSRIEQNAGDINLSAGKISTNAQNIANLKITANGISSTVSSIKGDISSINSDVKGLNKDVSFAFSQIEQTASKISTKVGYGDVISSINQSSERISINANRVDLTGITTIYDSSSSNNYAMFNGGSFGLYTNGSRRLSIHPDISMVKFTGNPIQFSSSVYFDSTVDFSKANVVGLDVTAIFG